MQSNKQNFHVMRNKNQILNYKISHSNSFLHTENSFILCDQNQYRFITVSFNLDSSDVSTITLALQTLANFQFFINESEARQTRLPPSPFMEFCFECSSAKYLCHENMDIRMYAVAAVIAIMRPYIPLPCMSANGTIVSHFTLLNFLLEFVFESWKVQSMYSSTKYHLSTFFLLRSLVAWSSTPFLIVYPVLSFTTNVGEFV